MKKYNKLLFLGIASLTIFLAGCSLAEGLISQICGPCGAIPMLMIGLAVWMKAYR